VFISQGLSKLPFDPAVGEGFGLPALVWWFVCYGELAAGVGLLVGGLATLPRINCIATGVIWTVIKPESLLAFIVSDYLHFSLWAGGLYFALRGNWAVAVNKK